MKSTGGCPGKEMVMNVMKVHCVVAMALLAGGLQAQEPPSLPKLENPLAGVAATESSLADQTGIAVTIYNNDLALVRDTRKIKLLPGEQSLRFMDVAQKVRPETVSLKSLTAPGSLAILEQNYEFDLISPSKLMEKYVGKPVRLVNFNNQIGFTEKDAELLSVNEGPVFKVGEEIYLGMPGQVVLPKIPENLIPKPSLVWLLQNTGTDHEVEVTYLTGGIQWRADYVLTLAKDEKTLDVEGWVTLINQSGAQYRNAQLKVVAGEVNIVQSHEMAMDIAGAGAKMMRAAPAPMREESFAEYHLYTLPRRTTIKENESKQVSLLTATGVSVKKIYEYRGNVAFYSQQIPPQKEEKVGVFLVLRNSEANHLGMPLPAGVMRVYQQDQDGMLQFAGEDNIKHTPKDEDVRLRLGNAFDIVGERVQTDFRQLAPSLTEAAFKIAIRNHKEIPITVDIVEPMAGDWEITEKSQEFVKKDAQTAVFSVPVAKNGETVVTYRVRVKY